jgi:trans-2-enoyl-CoA reductase
MYIQSLLWVTFLCYIVSQTNAINIPKMQKNILRLYVFSQPKHIRKGLFRQIKNFYSNKIVDVNVYMIDVNNKYYSLSEDDRTLIETIISLAI